MSKDALEAIENNIDSRIFNLEVRSANNKLVTKFLREVLGELHEIKSKRANVETVLNRLDETTNSSLKVTATNNFDQKNTVVNDLETVLKMARDARAHDVGALPAVERGMIHNTKSNLSSGGSGTGSKNMKSMIRSSGLSKVPSKNSSAVSAGAPLIDIKSTTVGTRRRLNVNVDESKFWKCVESTQSPDLNAISSHEASNLSGSKASNLNIEEEFQSICKIDALNVIFDSFCEQKSLSKSKYNSLHGDLVVAQTFLLSILTLKDRNRISLPNCYLYSILQESSLNGDHLSEKLEEIDVKIDQQDVTLKLATIVGNICDKYEKILKPRMLRLKFEHLDIEDKKDIFRLWYQMKSIYDYYSRNFGVETLENSSINSKQKISSSSFTELIERTPNRIHYLVNPSGRGFYRAEQRWLKSTLGYVDRYMSSFSSRVQYACEIAIAKDSLRSNISKLKFCCQRQAESSVVSPNKYQSMDKNNELGQEWVESLSMFRDVYCCLVKSAESYQGCCYLEKLTN